MSIAPSAASLLNIWLFAAYLMVCWRVLSWVDRWVQRRITAWQYGGKVPACTPGSCFCDEGCAHMLGGDLGNVP